MFFNISFLYSIYKEFCRSDIGVDFIENPEDVENTFGSQH